MREWRETTGRTSVRYDGGAAAERGGWRRGRGRQGTTASGGARDGDEQGRDGRTRDDRGSEAYVHLFERLAKPTRALKRGRPAASWPGTPHKTAWKGRE